MNCYNHPDSVAVSTCKKCNNGLCNKCSTNHPLCKYCRNLEVFSEKKIIILELLAIVIIGFLIKMYSAEFLNIDLEKTPDLKLSYLEAIYISGAYITGYRLLTGRYRKNKKDFTITVEYNVIGRIIGKIVLFLISPFVGMFVFPFILIRNIYKLLK